ncbi:MAG: response regulator [Bryobacteraceae bacterium]
MGTQDRRYRILVVDDQDSYRESERLLLQSEGYEVVEARGPGEAQGLLKESPFHLSLLDNQMPDEDGVMRDDAGMELARWIRKHCPYTSCIIVTGFERVELVKKAIAEHLVNNYYAKDDIAAGSVGGLSELVAKILGERLVTLSAKNELPLKVDSLDLWGEVGIVERDLCTNGAGVVRFGIGAVMARIHPLAQEWQIRAGSRVVGRAVSGGEIEVIPASASTA